MKRALGGLLLVAHGLAHALPATQAGAVGRSWLFTPLGLDAMAQRWIVALLSTLAMAGFVVAGFGVWGVPSFRRAWRRAGLVAAGASMVLIPLFWLNAYGVVGLAIDVAVVLGLRSLPVVWSTGRLSRKRPGSVKEITLELAHIGAVAFVGWLTLASLAAPWHRLWGSTAAELAMPLPGDESLDGPPTYWIQHAVSIDAPPGIVWPWLAQLGTDRGGFYSYAWLERLFGIDVRNAGRIHEEWQDVRTGGFITAAPAGYLGFDRPLGWRLGLVEPGRVMVLETWGAFVLEPTPEGGTRFIVRTRSGGGPDLLGLATAWFGLTVFEPAHFIMERQMLLGVKRRAEGTIRESHAVREARP